MLMRLRCCVGCSSVFFEPKNHDLAGVLPQLPNLKKKKNVGKDAKGTIQDIPCVVPNDAS